MKNPKLIVKPFAKNGQKNVIPENYETSMESNQATWDQGFGQITMLPVAAGGLPPKGQDFNGIFNQLSENIVYLSQGGRFKFSAEYAEAIGGYPKGAILQSDDEKKEYLSLINNNKVNFNVAPDISASWKLVNTDDLLAQIASKQPTGDYATKTEVNSKLAKDQNGADIPNKDTFIKNLHLEETVKQAAGAMQKSANGGDIQNVAAFRNALQLGTAALASMGVGKNQVLSASDFSSLVSGNGFLYIPSIGATGETVKIMLQWGIIKTRGGENAIYNLPYAFPTGGLLAVGNRGTSGYNAAMNVRLINRSQIDIQNWSPAGSLEDCCFFAVGYL